MSQKEQTYTPGLHLQQDGCWLGILHTSATTAPTLTLALPQDLCISYPLCLWDSSPRMSTWSASFLAVRSCLNCIHLRESFSVALFSKESCPTLPGHHIIHFLQSNYHRWNHVYTLTVYLSSLLNCQLSGIRDLIHLACHTLTTTQTNTGTEQLAEMFTVWLKILLSFPPLLQP